MNPSSFSLKGKVILVTGGTGIIGHALLHSLAKEGASLVILGRDLKKLKERENEFTALGTDTLSVQADVLNKKQLVQANEAILKKFGRLDGLINAAGGNVPEGILQPDQDIFGLSVDGMKKAMDLNLWGTLEPTLVFGRTILNSGGGSILNVSSLSADRCLTKVLGYSMGKAAVEAFTKWFAVEVAIRFGEKIRMNAIRPGFFITEQNRSLLTDMNNGLTLRGRKVIDHTPAGRFGQPEELGGTVVWLMSDASKFVTGSTVTVDGGFAAYSGV